MLPAEVQSVRRCQTAHHTGPFPPRSEAQALYVGGRGSTTDLVYAKGVSYIPSPDPTSFDRNKYSIFIVDIGLHQDPVCDYTITEKTAKYFPLIAAPNKY